MFEKLIFGGNILDVTFMGRIYAAIFVVDRLARSANSVP